MLPLRDHQQDAKAPICLRRRLRSFSKVIQVPKWHGCASASEAARQSLKCLLMHAGRSTIHAYGAGGIGASRSATGSFADRPDRRELNANSRMIIDATTPFTWKNHPLAGDIISTPERTRAILAKWGWILE